jgi:outer membrane protein assembly factor BamB
VLESEGASDPVYNRARSFGMSMEHGPAVLNTYRGTKMIEAVVPATRICSPRQSGRFNFALALLIVLGCSANAEDWSHWRGASRNDHSIEDSGWDRGAWPLQRPLWEADVGEGGSSPLVIGERVYVIGYNDPQDDVACLDAATGKTLWKKSYRCPIHGRQSTGDEGLYTGPTSTPEFDPETGYLYTLSCDGDLHCWDTARNGETIWSLNLYEKYQVPQRPRFGRQGRRDYGYTTAPLVWGDWVIVEVGDDEGNLIAFDKKLGRQVWTSEHKGPAGHTGGLVTMDVEGIPCVAVLTYDGLHVARLDAANPGKRVALFPWGTDFANNVATPAALGSDVLITAAYNHNAICRIHVTLEGASKVWERPFASKICSPTIHRGKVYWAWHQVHCLDFETGDQLWEGGEFGEAGSCIATKDGRLLVWGDRGRLALIEMAERSADKYIELSRTDSLAKTEVWPHLAISNGRMFCKDRLGKIKCFSLNPKIDP